MADNDSKDVDRKYSKLLKVKAAVTERKKFWRWVKKLEVFNPEGRKNGAEFL